MGLRGNLCDTVNNYMYIFYVYFTPTSFFFKKAKTLIQVFKPEYISELHSYYDDTFNTTNMYYDSAINY